MLANSLICINNKQGTRINNNGTLSILDLAIISIELASSSSFNVIDDPLGSDHLPIVVDFNKISDPIKMISPNTLGINLNKINWLNFNAHLIVHFNSFEAQNYEIQDSYDFTVSCLNDAI